MKRFVYAIAAAFVAMFMAASAAHANSARIKMKVMVADGGFFR